MMRWMLGVVLSAAACVCLAQEADWTALTGDQITQILTGRVLDYGDKWQDFRASGRTLYFSGAESWGYWDVRGDQYCSMWPPSDLWGCYDVAQSGEALRFVGAQGDVTDGVLRPVAGE